MACDDAKKQNYDAVDVDDSFKPAIAQYEEMIKSVVHLRMKTAKMTQEAIEAFEPDLKQKIEEFKHAKESNEINNKIRKVGTEEDILTFEHVKDLVDKFCNNPY